MNGEYKTLDYPTNSTGVGKKGYKPLKFYIDPKTGVVTLSNPKEKGDGEIGRTK